MNQKIFVFAVAATLIAPWAAKADVKLSGVIQGEITSSEVGDPDDDEDRKTLTKDSDGAVFNGGPNKIIFDIDEKLGNGVTAYARYRSAFSTSENKGLNRGQEAYLGLKTSSFYIRYGKLTGAYKSSKGLVDPWAGTSLQARSTGGGMSGSAYNGVGGRKSTNHRGLAHSGFIEGALEAGIKFAGFYGRVQGVVDDNSDMDGAGLLELRFTAPSFAIFASGAYTDLDLKGRVENALDDDEEENDGLVNWKVGGHFKLGPALKLGIQYEDAELGAFENNSDGGRYILGSIDFTMNNVTIAGWVAGYLSDIDDARRMFDAEGNQVDEDALSWALGGKYHFSKRTMIYAGYRQTDSDNDIRDEDVATLGIRHKF